MKLTKDTLIEGRVYKEGVEYSVKPIQESSIRVFDPIQITNAFRNEKSNAEDEVYSRFFDEFYTKGKLDGTYTDDLSGENEAIEDLYYEYAGMIASLTSKNMAEIIIDQAVKALDEAEEDLNLPRNFRVDLSDNYEIAFKNAVNDNF